MSGLPKMGIEAKNAGSYDFPTSESPWVIDGTAKNEPKKKPFDRILAHILARDAEHIEDTLAELFWRLGPRNPRPVFVSMPSFQFSPKPFR